jgi:hypothetical protein
MYKGLKRVAASLTLAFALVAGGVMGAGAQTDVKATAATTTLAAKTDTAEAAAQVALVLGQEMPDHSVFAGFTADGKQEIFAMPKDLGVTMTFNDAAEAVKKMNAENALGHNDWQIPALDNLHVLQKNQNEGTLKGTFKTASSRDDSVYPDWYWSSTENRDGSSDVHNVRFSYGYEGWDLKDYRLSCRPVRLVAAPSLG